MGDRARSSYHKLISFHAVIAGICLLFVSNFFPSATVARQPEPDSPAAALRIVVRGANSSISVLPVPARILLNSHVAPGSVQIFLNGKSVTGDFSYVAPAFDGGLRTAGGLRLSTRSANPRTNVLRVSATALDGSPVTSSLAFTIFTSKNALNSVAVKNRLDRSGGLVVLPGVVDVQVPIGTFTAPSPISVSATSTVETDRDFVETAHMFDANRRLPYEIKVNTFKLRPRKNLVVKFKLPSTFIRQVPADSEIKAFIQFLQDAGQATLDNFELRESRFDPVTGVLAVSVPPTAFTGRRSLSENLEVILLVGSTPTKPDPAAIEDNADKSSRRSDAARERPLPVPPDGRPGLQLQPRSGPSNSTDIGRGIDPILADCGGTTLGAPLATLNVTSPYKANVHHGTDYEAATGTNVLAMADGVIEKIGLDERELKKPDPRSGKLIKGWGRYVVIRHSDGSKTLYAHLVTDSVNFQVGNSVLQGSVIALSNDSGGSSGPHLHVEYAPDGKIYKSGSKVNPASCINSNGTGSIVIRDNGSLADDAFAVGIDGIIICQTSVGATNTCAVGALRSGAANLGITCLVAPDDVGTYEVALSNGITFSDGTTTRSGTLPQGGSVNFQIIIP